MNKQLQAIYLEIVDNQLRSNEPPETGKTLKRLRSLGYSVREAKLLIASAVAVETFHMLKKDELYNQDRFKRNLDILPDQSFEEE